MQSRPTEHSGVLDPEDGPGNGWSSPGLERSFASASESPPDCPVTAVIDIGSGSARAVVMRVNEGGGIEVIAQQRMNLDLMSHVSGQGALDAESIRRTLDAVEDFVQVCVGYGAGTIHAVGTEALRESQNAAEITESAANRFGVSFRVISGFEEAAYCFIGAVHGLPVNNGLMADLGAGSLEVVGFAHRSLESLHSLPLGSLRIANQFELTDQPNAEDVTAAYRYVKDYLESAHLLNPGTIGSLVGSGGSMRLLARLDRRRVAYPVLKMHGYCISGENLANLTNWLAGATRDERHRIPGMNPQRTHSIVGGAVVAQALLEHVGADRIMVSGQGLREGLARHPSPLPEDSKITLPPRLTVRIDGLAGLVQRFALRFSERGPRRANLARRLVEAGWRGRRARMTCSLQGAALVLDIGSAIDFYNRFNRTATVIACSDLPGFTHRESAQIAAILLTAERGKVPRLYRNTPLLTAGDKRRLGQAAAALRVADELDRRLPPGCPAESVSISRECGVVTVVTPAWSKASAAGIGERWESEFNQPIHIRRGER